MSDVDRAGKHDGLLLGARSKPASAARRPAIWSVASTELQVLFAAVFLFGLFAFLYPDSFATEGTMRNMVRVAGILLVVGIGQSFALIVGGFDISVGSNMGLVSVLVALLAVSGTPVPTAILVGIATGALIGLVNGLLIAKLNITPFVTTLGMLTFLRGLADELGNGGSIVGLPAELSFFGRANWGFLPSAGAIAFIAFAIAWFILNRTRAGLYIFSIGGSRETCRLAGVPVTRYEILAYTCCGAFAGLAGVMLTARVAVGQANIGQGFDLLSIATAVIGGVAIGGGSGRLSGVLLGVLLLTILTTGLDIAGINTFYQQMVTGLVLICAVLVAQARNPQLLKRLLRLRGETPKAMDPNVLNLERGELK
ncbi:ABC transporter permease [Rhodoligotrophos defluvii]|uniref:ABC transporter permease n=1 Tax=Rhodoligotrophos defluvii TaxID=2561934 RepID=UPI001485561D|nr:ABC transporter permease [Rhodoligotrophos defluvii]